MPTFSNKELQKLRQKTAGQYGGIKLTDKQLIYGGSEDEKSTKPSAKPKASLASTLKNLASSAYHGVADKYGELSSGIAESLAFDSKDQSDARKSRDILHQANMNSIKTGHSILSDPNADEKKKERARKLIQKAIASENESYTQATARNKEITERTDPKKGAANVAGIGLDVLTAGATPIKGGAGLRTARLGKMGETGRSVGQAARAGAAFGAAGQGASSVAQQIADEGKVDVKRTAIDTALGGVLGGLSDALPVRAANKRQDIKIAAARKKAAEDKKMTDTVNEIVNGKNPEQKLLGAGTDSIQKRIDEIDSQLDEYRGRGSGSKFTPEEKNMGNLGTDKESKITGDLKFQKNRKDGKLVTDKSSTAGTMAESPGKITQVKSAKELRDLMKERAVLEKQLTALQSPVASKIDEATSATKPSLSQAIAATDEAPNASSAPAVTMPVDTTEAAVNAQNGLQKAYRSVDTSLRKSGEHGSLIADGLQTARDLSEKGQAEFIQSIPTVLKLNDREMKQFADYLDDIKNGRDSVINSENVQQAAAEWMDAIPKVRDRAKAAGIDVGDLGATYFPKNYEQTLGSKKGYESAINHLVNTGQAKTRADAIKQLDTLRASYGRNFGHFDKSRKLDLPEYDKSKNAVVGYIRGAFDTIGNAEQFGAKGERAKELIDKMASKDPHVAATALRDYMIATGEYKFRAENYPTLMKTLHGVKTFNRMRALGLSSVLNLGQSTNTATKYGIFRTAGAMFKLLSPGEREYIKKSGVILDSVLSQLRSGAGIDETRVGLGKIGSALDKAAGKVTAPGFNSVERFNRSVAAEAGKSWAQSAAKKAANGDAKAEAALRAMGVKGDIGSKLTEEQLIDAGRGAVKTTQFKTDALDLAPWMSSPEGKMVSQFRTFVYKQTGFLYKEVLKEAQKGNVKPLMRFLAVGIPIGYATGQARDALSGRNNSGIAGVKKEQDSITEELMSALGNVGAFGVASDAMNLVKNRKSQRLPEYVAGTLGGPTAGYGVQTISNVSQAFNGSPKPLQRQGLKTVPVAGSYLASHNVPYAPDVSDKQLTFIDKSSDNQKQALYGFFTDLENRDVKKKDVSAEVKAAVAAGQYNRAQRIADENNKQVDDATEHLRREYGEVPEELQKYIDSTYKVSYDYYYNRAN